MRKGYGEEGTNEKEEDLCSERLAHPSQGLWTTFQGLGCELYPTLIIVCAEKLILQGKEASPRSCEPLKEACQGKRQAWALCLLQRW